MFAASQTRDVCIAAIVFTAVISLTTMKAAGAAGADCDKSKLTEVEKLEAYLEKLLAAELTNKSIELIGEWQVQYQSQVLLEKKLADAQGAIAKKQLAAQQAQVDYLAASANQKALCSYGP